MLRFCSLGSGSGGNALVVEARAGLFTTRVLVDNGFGPRALQDRLARVGLTPADVDALLVTHEHSDHVGGVAPLLKRLNIPCFATAGTARAAELDDSDQWRPIRDGQDVIIGDLCVRPFAVPHDAAEPVQFVFGDGERRLGLLTDIGMIVESVARALDGLDAFVIECNHDLRMLDGGDYPPFLKARIRGDRGHLSNAQAAALLGNIDRSRLRLVAAAHLSRKNNRPHLAQQALAEVLDCAACEIVVADQDDGLRWIDL